jgi:uncharacterized membrane protein
MITTLKFFAVRNMKRYLPLVVLTFFSIILLLVRVKITQSVYYLFLVWNLFLAALPLGVSLIINSTNKIKNNKYFFYPALMGWLILLPNAPYLVTDFMHFRHESSVPFWLDLLILGSFSISGFLFGLASMHNVYKTLSKKWHRAAAMLFMASTCLLSGLGIYIGRMLRYNSWDVLCHPIRLVTDVINGFVAPATILTAWGITLGFGFLQFLLFDLYTSSEK